MITIYGIKNCDTIKKTLRWFEQQKCEVEFVDFKKTPPNTDLLEQFIQQFELNKLINQRGTTWRQLPDATKLGIKEGDKELALAVMLENSSVIKRPVINSFDQWCIGYNENEFKRLA